MDDSSKSKTYEPVKIPERTPDSEEGHSRIQPKKQTADLAPDRDGLFHVLAYDPAPSAGSGTVVHGAQKIEPIVKDAIREKFHEMRAIDPATRTFSLTGSRFFDRNVRRENAKVFYRQGRFMEAFTDDFAETVPFKEYFPYYQLMGYKQLRTYFTWRTNVRDGTVAGTSLSYAFLYLYELINNIGVADPQDGLDRLMKFWQSFRVYEPSLDKYVLRWLKDYHIYYQMPQSFKEFVEQNGLTDHYPKMADSDDNFDLFCAVSQYDIRKSAFFKDNSQLLIDAFYSVTNMLRTVFVENGIHFDESVFQPTRRMSVWHPFRDALFYPWMNQPDRRIVLSENEIYLCRQNKWAFSTVITTNSGRQLIGYVMKQMESVLRSLTRYRYKLTARADLLPPLIVGRLNVAGLSLERLVTDAVRDFYREATKTVVSVDPASLLRIRKEALDTQEKLIVDEQNEPVRPVVVPHNLSLGAPQTPSLLPEVDSGNDSDPVADAWADLKNALGEAERKALSVVVEQNTDLKSFADKQGVMLEVLIDGINEKAMDFIGDNLLDESFTLYEEYKDQVEGMIHA